jgi:HEAT repeat protein
MKLIEGKPLLVFVDDLQYADEATLFLWKALQDRNETRLLVCGTVSSAATNGRDEEASPWLRFREAAEGPPILRRRLEPFSPEEIETHLASIFPNLERPPAFETSLGRSSAGNPLLLGELLRNLVLAGRISPWSTPGGVRFRAKLPRGHRFPRSIAAIVRRSIDALDDESHSLLEQIAVLGDSVPLSLVVGSTGASEHDVLDFAECAEDLGLLRADFHINDHTLRFRGKPALDIIYSSIPKDRRQKLHEHIGAYLEELHRRGVGPSASVLAYHFSRSANPKKAARYAQLAHKVRSVTFEPDEAQHYQNLSAQVLTSLPNLFRMMVAAIRSLQITPLEDGEVLEACRSAHEATTEILDPVRRLVLSRGAGGLLVNGYEIDAGDFGFPTEYFVDLLDRVGLESVGFRRGVSADELQLLLRELGGAEAANATAGYWATFASERALEHVFLREQPRTNRHEGRQSLASALENETDPDLERPEASALVALFAQQSKDELIEALPAVSRDLLVNGEHKLARKAVRRVFTDYAIQEVAVRRRILDACRALLESSSQSVHNQLAAIVAEELLKAFREEGDDYLLGDLATLLYSLTGAILRFADFALAGRIFAELRQRQRELMKAARATGRGFTVLNRRVDSTTRALLMEELQAKDPVRQERAALVLESLGKPAIALLIDVIKQEKDFRTRQLAAGLLSGMGRDAADRIKQEVVLEVTAEQRLRLLEVIDVVTRDLRSELAFCISDMNPRVRRAALRLAERLNDEQVLELLLDFARHPDIEVAKGAIRSLACLRSSHVANALIGTLEDARDAERVIACAQALAQLGDPAAVRPLAEVLTARRFPVIGPFRWDNQVRATAAFALAHIGGEGARSVLKQVANDPDPRIRQIAVHGTSGTARPVPLIAESEHPSREGEGVA